jgi:hypothetical protein
MRAMTRKDRILTAMRHGQPDRVPVSSYEINPWDPAAWQHGDRSYADVLAATREYADCIWMWDPPIGNAALDRITTRACPTDGSARVTTVRIETPRGDLVSRSRRRGGIKTSWTVEPLVKDEEDIDRWLSIPFEFAAPDLASYFEAETRVGDDGIVQGDIADPLCEIADLPGLQGFASLSIENPARIREMMDQAQERLLVCLEHVLKNTPVPAFRIFGPEYAAPPIMAPSAFREFVVPYDREIINLIHKYGRLARLHCHGGIRDILDDIVEMGADATDPVEPTPFGDITLREAKEKAGDRLCLIGNIETDLLERGSEEEVARAVRECMDAAKAGGGYIICPTAMPICSPLPDRASRNIIRYLEEADVHARY